ncbi:MAG: hypothetical protein N2651_02410, partial [Fimbriimonadales bacterium]|nr:hypothetical protein [Fimbriimonadales bacterium]
MAVMKPWRQRWGCSLIVGVATTIVVFTGMFAVLHHIHTQALGYFRDQLHHRLISVASVAATMVDAERHLSLKIEDTNTPEYQKMLEPLFKIVEADTDIIYLYTIALKEGKVYFMLDPMPPDDYDGDGAIDPTHPWDEYREASEEFYQVFTTGKPQVTDLYT